MEALYTPIKHIHMSLIVFNVLFFIIRAAMMFAAKPIHQKKWAKITARVTDTLLLVSALMLCIILNQFPFVDAWITEKFIRVSPYIILAYIALYRAETLKSKILTTVGALGWIAIIANLALFKQPFILG